MVTNQFNPVETGPVEQRTVSIPLIIGIVLVPYVFTWFLLRPGYSKRSRILGISWMLVFFLTISMGAQAPKSVEPTVKAVDSGDTAQKKARLDRNTKIVIYAKSLLAAARNPSSVVFERVLTNESGELSCFKYQAENGFGGTNREWVAFTPAGGQNEGPDVKLICEDKVMSDVTSELLPLIDLVR